MKGIVSIKGRNITNLHLADGSDFIAWNEQGLIDVVDRLEKVPSDHGIDISAEKTNMTSSKLTRTTKVKKAWIGDRHKFQVHQMKAPCQKNSLKNCPDHYRTVKTPTYLEEQERHRELKDKTYEVLGYLDVSIALWFMDTDCWPGKKKRIKIM